MEEKLNSNVLDYLRGMIVSSSKDMVQTRFDATLWGIMVGWDKKSYKELKSKLKWTNEQIENQKILHKEYTKILKSQTMKKTISNLRQANHFIQETENSIKTVKGWDEKMCKPGEKEQEINQLKAHLARHKEVKRRVLEQIIIEASDELKKLND